VNAVASVLGCSTQSNVCDYTKPTIEIDDSNFVYLGIAQDDSTYYIDFGNLLDVSRGGTIVYFDYISYTAFVVAFVSDNIIPDGYTITFVSRDVIQLSQIQFVRYTYAPSLTIPNSKISFQKDFDHAPITNGTGEDTCINIIYDLASDKWFVTHAEISYLNNI
jgi:hypothetical protein